MKFAGDSGRGNVVVVGVKLLAEDERRSRELLTWTLANVARPGDRIVALYVINTIIESTASLLSLVKMFDSMLAAYQGFCNLKQASALQNCNCFQGVSVNCLAADPDQLAQWSQVELKLKVCRGISVRKTLVREAKLCGASSVIVGTSEKHHTIRSSASMAKYCKRNLPKNLSVFAVANGKSVFQREATITNDDSHVNRQRLVYRSSKNIMEASKGTEELNFEQMDNSERLTLERADSSCTSSSGLPDNSSTQSLEEFPKEEAVDNLLALVPVQTSQACSGSKSGWTFLRWLFVCKRKHSKRSAAKLSVLEWFSRLRGHHSPVVIYPDHKRCHLDHDKNHSASFDGEGSAIVPYGSEAAIPRSTYSGSSNPPKELEGLHERYSSTCRLFTYPEILSATSGLASENMVGKGGSSYVYRGCLSDGKELAMKILKPSADVLKEFVLEIDIVASLHHKNVLSLFGYCFENNNLILLYDFLPRGSLEENLHGRKRDENVLGWPERYKVAVGVAEALDYLHNGHDPPVIHKDVKSSNILLSDDFEPQLSDFGFASLASSTFSPHITCTDVAGTFGYLAPEYFMNGKVSDKIDVYAFGVVLLELLSGRKPICSGGPKGHESLVMWGKPILEAGRLSQLLDPSLSGNYNHNLIERMVLAATLCIRRAPGLRPQISLVLKLLQGDVETTSWARQQVAAPSEEANACDDEEASPTDIESHINLALLDLEEDSISDSSPDQGISVEEYLKGRWSCASSVA